MIKKGRNGGAERLFPFFLVFKKAFCEKNGFMKKLFFEKRKIFKKMQKNS